MRPVLPVSVVIPAYRAARDLPAALASIAAQTYRPAEVIVVDDGSPDDGAEVARRLGALVVRQANAGCGPARNAGVEAAHSPWIAFLDADDRWEPKKLERQWAARAWWPPAEVIATDYARLAGGRVVDASALAGSPSYPGAPKLRLGPDVAYVSREALAAWLPRGQFLAPSSLLVTRDLARAVPFSAWPPSTSLAQVAEDLEWYLRLARRTGVLVIEEPLVRYAVGTHSLSSNPGRTHYGVVVLGRAVAAHPDAYADGSLSAFRRVLPAGEARAVRAFLRDLDTERALAVIGAADRRRRSRQLGPLAVVARIARWPPAARLLPYARALWQRRKRLRRS